MKYLVYPLAFLFFGIAFSNCKKEESTSDVEIEIIYSESYYPCNPNTGWYYLQDDSISVKIEVSSSFENHYLRSFDNGDTTRISETKKVPMRNSVPIYGYDFVYHKNDEFGNTEVLWPILREEIGATYDKFPMSTKFGDFNEHMVVTGKSFNGIDSVLTIEGHWVYGPNLNKRSYETYTKNIGLTSRYIVDTVLLDTTYKLEFEAYFVTN